MQSLPRGGWRSRSFIRPAFLVPIMQMINDGIGLLLGLAPVAALVALVLAGLALRNHGSALQNGRFGLWMFWAAVMLTLPQILSWFSGFGVPVPVSAGGGTALFNTFKVDITNFVNQFVVGYLAPVLAAWMVLRGVVEISEGRSPLYSILGAMFLLSIAATQALMQGWNSGTKFATADVLAGLWTYTASRILPVAAGLAIIGAILEFLAFWQACDAADLTAAAGFLTVSAPAAVGRFDDVTPRVYELSKRNHEFDERMGNVIMPTVVRPLLFALAVVRYARGYPHQYIAWLWG